MQEWIIAMLVISALLIFRDMAKTILFHKEEAKEELEQLYETHPQKERVERYADSFKRLAETFYGMPYRKDFLSNVQVEHVFQQTYEKMCTKCHQREICWGKRAEKTFVSACKLVRAIEDGEEETVRKARSEWMGECICSNRYYEECCQYFNKEKQNLIWNNRMIENRLAVAEQLTEVSKIMKMVAEDLYDIVQAEPEFKDQLEKKLRKKHVLIKNVWVIEKAKGKQQVYLTIRARSGQCISMLEVAQQLSEVCECPMTPTRDSRCVVNGEFHTVHFVEDSSYEVLYGVAKVTKDKEKVSGDNFSCNVEEDGQFVMCLSDGMGSGMEACRESEIVVELLEQFIESGFTRETAAKMVNSSLILQRQDGMFSTLDICSLDLYTGICSFLKAGAATTFIKRDHWVEAISSTSMAVGLMQQVDFETTTRKLYNGDYLIMVTDGVLDALPLEKEEETMKEIIMQVHGQAPQEVGRGILDRVLGYCNYVAKDDMTVLVAGMWKK